MNRCTAWFPWAPQQLRWLLLLGIAVSPLAYGQNTTDSQREVQRLSVEAKVAQQRGDNNTAIEKYGAIVKLAPKLAPAYNNLGMLYLKNGDYFQAVEALNRALELDPGLHSASGMLGMSYFQLGMSAKAESPLREALRFNPGDDNARMTLALVLIDLKQYEEAASHLNRFLDRNPKNAEGWYALRKTYLQMADEARVKINEINPDSVVAHEVAGEIDESGLNYSGAMAEYKKAIDEAPNQPGTHMSMGNVYWRLGKWEAAQAEFKAELVNNPNNCTAHWKVADAMLEANDSSKDALSELNRSIDICPGLVQARIDRGRALIRLGEHTQALPDLLIAEKDRPAEPTIHFLLASVYKAQGRAADAQREMNIFEQLQRQSAAAGMGK